MSAVVERVEQALGIVSGLILVFLAVVVTAGVVGRAVWGSEVVGVVEGGGPLLVAAVGLGMALAQRRGKHLEVTLVTDRLPTSWASVVRLIGRLAYLAIVGWMCYAIVPLALGAYESGVTTTGLVRWPLWPAWVALATGMVILTIELLIQLVAGEWRETSAESAVPVAGMEQSI